MGTNLKNLIVYRNLLNDEIISNLNKKQLHDPAFSAKLVQLAETEGWSGNILEQHLLTLMSKDENIFTRFAERGDPLGSSLEDIVASDLLYIINFMEKINANIEETQIFKNYLPGKEQSAPLTEEFKNILLQKRDIKLITQALYRYYKKYSFGIMSECKAFVWRTGHGLVGVKNTQLESFDKLVGYEYQKKILRENTQAFLNNLPANNILLYGDRGTGKSSSIKALVPEYATQGLRLVEISKSDFGQIPEIMGTLSQYGRKFILILDDLSFERFEIEYKQLKSYMDGTLEQKPSNVLIYATSNRRNIINETWEEQQGEEIHVRDSINERTSLVDRFGIKIYYESPGQEEYFRIVSELAKRNNIDISEELLRKEANKWQMCSSGRSGRIARNFINNLLAELAKAKKYE